jgi:hypothetical protein
MFHSRTRFEMLAAQHYELLAQQEVFGLKPRKPREWRSDSEQQLGRNATIGRSMTIRGARSDEQSGARPNHGLGQAVWRARDSAFPYHEAA